MSTTSVCLLSGGLDSCVASSIADRDSKIKAFISVEYGQRHVRELESAISIAQHFNSRHYLLQIPRLGMILSTLHATALVDHTESLPSNRRISEMGDSVPRSYVPGRNTIMLSLAQSLGEALDVDHIYCGFNAVDYSGYPDCRPEYVESWNGLARLSTKRGSEGRPITLIAPIIDLSKTEIVRRGIALNSPLELTWSCYAGGKHPCGRCDSCIIRWNAFQDCGMSDPAGDYETVPERSVA